MLEETLLGYRNLKDVTADGFYSFGKQVGKINKALTNGELSIFTFVLGMLCVIVACLFIWAWYTLLYIISKVVYGASIKKNKIRYYTSEERKRNEILNELEDYNIPVSHKIILEKKEETLKERSLKILRKYLMLNDQVLRGTIIRTTFPKVTSEELLECATTGSLNKPFMVQRVTFSNELNKALKVIFPKLKTRKVKGQEDTYIVFEGNEVFALESELRKVMMKPVTINLRTAGC